MKTASIRTIVRSVFLAFSLTLVSLGVIASPLDDARNAGYVIELPTGYIGATDKAPANIQTLVNEINQGREQAYARIARKNGITTEQVAAESYRKRMEKP